MKKKPMALSLPLTEGLFFTGEDRFSLVEDCRLVGILKTTKTGL